MTGHNTGIAAVGAVAAGAMGGPLAEVFNELALVLVIMGAGGGATRGLALRLPWLETVRGIVLGGLMAGGLGVILPYIVGPWLPPGMPATVPVLAACAYLVGFLQDTVVSRLQRTGDRDG